MLYFFVILILVSLNHVLGSNLIEIDTRGGYSLELSSDIKEVYYSVNTTSPHVVTQIVSDKTILEGSTKLQSAFNIDQFETSSPKSVQILTSEENHPLVGTLLTVEHKSKDYKVPIEISFSSLPFQFYLLSGLTNLQYDDFKCKDKRIDDVEIRIFSLNNQLIKTEKSVESSGSFSFSVKDEAFRFEISGIFFSVFGSVDCSVTITQTIHEFDFPKKESDLLWFLISFPSLVVLCCFCCLCILILSLFSSWICFGIIVSVQNVKKITYSKNDGEEDENNIIISEISPLINTRNEDNEKINLSNDISNEFLVVQKKQVESKLEKLTEEHTLEKEKINRETEELRNSFKKEQEKLKELEERESEMKKKYYSDTKLLNEKISKLEEENKKNSRSRYKRKKNEQSKIVIEPITKQEIGKNELEVAISKVVRSEIVTEVKKKDRYSHDKDEKPKNVDENKDIKLKEETVEKTKNILKEFEHTLGIISDKGYIDQEKEKRKQISLLRDKLRSLRFEHLDIRSFIASGYFGACYECIIRLSGRTKHHVEARQATMILVSKFLFHDLGDDTDRDKLFSYEYPVDEENQNLYHKNLVEIILTNSKMKIKSEDLLKDELAHGPNHRKTIKGLQELGKTFGNGIVVMKYYPLTLGRYLKLRKYTQRHLQISEVCYLLKGILEGCKYLNDNKICHRDLHLENIFLEVKDLYSRVIIGDLGCCLNFNLRPGDLKGVMVVSKEHDSDYKDMMLRFSEYKMTTNIGGQYEDFHFLAPEIQKYAKKEIREKSVDVRFDYSSCDMYSIGKIGNKLLGEGYFDSSTLDDDNELKIMESNVKGLLSRMICDLSERVKFDESLIVLNDIIERIEEGYTSKYIPLKLLDKNEPVENLKKYSLSTIPEESEEENMISKEHNSEHIKNVEEQNSNYVSFENEQKIFSELLLEIDSELCVKSEENVNEETEGEDDDLLSVNIYTWGRGKYGALGHGNENNELIPKLVDKLSPFEISKMFFGCDCCSVILSNGDLLSWGHNYKRRLGHEENYREILSPSKLVELPQNRKIIQVSHGEFITLFLDDSGDIWGCGDSERGYLTGKKSSESIYIPIKINISNSQKITKIITGSHHFGCICSSGNLYTWGFGGGGRLGHGNDSSFLKPKIVEFFRNIRIGDVSMGGEHTLVLSEDGKLYSFGWGVYGQLGWKPKNGLYSSTPGLINYFDDNSIIITNISAGYRHSGALDSDGNCYIWGKGVEGQIGNGKFERNNFIPFRITQFINSSSEVIKLDIPNRHKFVSLDCGKGVHNICILEEKTEQNGKKTHVLTWGCGEDGRLGLNNEKNVNIPTVVPFFENKIVKSIFAGWRMSAAIL